MQDSVDPVHLVHRYRTNADREVVGFCAAALAFGRVESILSTLELLLAVTGPSPFEFIKSFEPNRYRQDLYLIKHRWIRGIDIVALLWIIRRMVEMSGSIERFFAEGYVDEASDIGNALESFSQRALQIDLSIVYGKETPTTGVQYFFPKPSSGSGCKRLNLFLRWMVRKDEIDLGVWSLISKSKLIIPLDTHIVRVGQCLNLTKYRSPSWRMAVDLTASLRVFAPNDPVKYDFSLCRLGMTSSCGFKQAHQDTNCPLRGLCNPSGCKRQVAN